MKYPSLQYHTISKFAYEVKVLKTYPAMLLKHRQDDGIVHHNLCVFSIQNDPLQEQHKENRAKRTSAKLHMNENPYYNRKYLNFTCDPFLQLST